MCGIPTFLGKVDHELEEDAESVQITVAQIVLTNRVWCAGKTLGVSEDKCVWQEIC